VSGWGRTDRTHHCLSVPYGREEGLGEEEVKTRPEHRKHISEMSAQVFSAYTRTASGPLSTNRVTWVRGIHSGSDKKRQKFYVLQCLKRGSPDDATTAAFNPWGWGCSCSWSGSATQGAAAPCPDMPAKVASLRGCAMCRCPQPPW